MFAYKINKIWRCQGKGRALVGLLNWCEKSIVSQSKKAPWRCEGTFLSIGF
jgi:hypothetical protein